MRVYVADKDGKLTGSFRHDEAGQGNAFQFVAMKPIQIVWEYTILADGRKVLKISPTQEWACKDLPEWRPE